VSQGTLENMLFNEILPIFRRLKAFRRLLAMGVNGRVKRYGTELAMKNKETWADALEVKMDLVIENIEYYNSVLSEIDHHLYV
jgi:hypothetical protein